MLFKSYLNLKLKFEVKHFTLIDLSMYISNPQCCEDFFEIGVTQMI